MKRAIATAFFFGSSSVHKSPSKRKAPALPAFVIGCFVIRHFPRVFRHSSFLAGISTTSFTAAILSLSGKSFADPPATPTFQYSNTPPTTHNKTTPYQLITPSLHHSIPTFGLFLAIAILS
jgi:hypothetical protein